MKRKNILSRKISENSNFIGLNLVIALDREKVAYAIILHFYKSNIQIHREKQLGPY